MSTQYGRIRTPALLGLAIATCLPSTANATIIYSGPSTYVINSTVTDNIVVNNSAAVLNVESGGVVQGVNDPTLLGAVRTQAGALNVRGNGRIEAGAGQSTAISMRGVPAVVRLFRSVFRDGQCRHGIRYWRLGNRVIARSVVCAGPG